MSMLTALKERKARRERAAERDEGFYRASQWKLIWRKFKSHRIAMVSIFGLAILYFMAVFCEFIAPYDIRTRFESYLSSPRSASASGFRATACMRRSSTGSPRSATR